jgi:hypothetical protein
MATTTTKPAERTIRFPKEARLDGIAVVELESGRPVFAVDAVEHTDVDANVELALSIPEHNAGRSAHLLSAFPAGTFRALYLGNGTVSDADINAAAVHCPEALELGWIHAAGWSRGTAATRLVLDVKSESFARLVSLTEFTARHCNFDDDALKSLCSGPARYGMILEDTEVTVDGLCAASHNRLRELVYSEHRVTQPHATSFGDWTSLARLTLGHAGLIDDQLDAVTAINSLQILELPRNDIFRRSSDRLGALPNLASLDLARTRINDTTVRSLSGLRNLQRLDLSATAITDDALEALAGMNRLSHLYLGSCDITNHGLARIVEQHPNLAVLDISRTLITPDAVPLLTRLLNLWRLEISKEMVCRDFLDMVDSFPALREFGFRGGIPDWELTGELVDYFGAANWLGVR